MSGSGFKMQLGDNISELEKQAAKLEKLISNCRAVRFKLMVECLHLKSELNDLQDSDNIDCSGKVKETSTNLDSVGTNVRLDLSVPSSSLHNSEELEEEEEMDEEE